MPDFPIPPPADTGSAFAITADHLLNGRVRFFQPGHGYRAAVDPVFLAAALRAPAGGAVVDLGCGAGAASLCLLARCPALGRVVGVERVPALARLAAINAAANGWETRFLPLAADLAALPLAPAGRWRGFDGALCNPPYLPAGAHTASANGLKAAAHGEDATMPLALWLKVAARLLAPGGRLAMIHRADRLDSLLAGLGERFGSVRIFPLWPRSGVAAGRVVITARRGGKGPLRLLPGLALHRDDGGFTAPAMAILREGASMEEACG